MKVLYNFPSLNTVYAGRTIYNGYKNAFEDLGHQFKPFTLQDDCQPAFDEYQPDIFICGLRPLALNNLDFEVIKRHKARGMKVFVNLPFWKSPLSKARINETRSLADNQEYIDLIKSGTFGDMYYNISEPGDPRMDGFEQTTGYKQHTIPLAADQVVLKEQFDEKFVADISFIGTFLPEKRAFFKKYVFPLGKEHKLKLYGQDWTRLDRMLGWVQRGGQQFNVPFLRSFRKPKLQLSDEAKIYKSSVVSINIHEDYQKKFGCDCNERTFKIPLCGGFEVTDDVACIHKYFRVGEEIVIGENPLDWVEKIRYYIRNPEKRLPIVEAGRRRVLSDHTYHNRVEQMLRI